MIEETHVAAACRPGGYLGQGLLRDLMRTRQRTACVVCACVCDQCSRCVQLKLLYDVLSVSLTGTLEFCYLRGSHLEIQAVVNGSRF